MTPIARSPGSLVWMGALVVLGAGACGGNARSGGDAGGNAADEGSPNTAEVTLTPTDTAGTALDLAAAMEVAPAADAGAVDRASHDVAAADAVASVDAVPPADVLVGPPGFDDLIVSGVGLQMFEGKTVYLAVESKVGTFRSSVMVASGQFVVTLPRAFDRDTFGMFVRIYVDLDGDGHCTAADAGAWSVFADNSARRGQPQPVEFDPRRESPQASECNDFP